MSIGIKLKDIAEKYPDKAAVIYEGSTMSYPCFYHSVCQLRQQLKVISQQNRSQRVGVLIGNEPVFLELFFAIVTLGWVAIPFDPKWSRREAEKVMNKAKPDIIISNKTFLESASYSFDNVYDIDRLKESSTNDNEIVKEIDENEPFYLGFTSGSTGTPKGYIRNHKSWLASFIAAEETFHYDQNDIILAPGPLCHSLTLFGAVHALHIGATFHMTPTFDPEEIRNILHERTGTIIYAVPTMLYQLANKNDYLCEKKLTFLSSGASLSQEVSNQLQDVYPNSCIYEYYGASELSFVSYTPEVKSAKSVNNVGKAFPGVHITIRDKEGDCVPNGEIGRIYIKSDFLFSGYVNNVTETNKVLTQFGASVDDLGFMNDEGDLTIIGREKNMLISGGLNVFPEEVEEVIKEFDGVQEAVVVGENDDYWGQKVIAFIKWEKHRLVNDLILHCKAHLTTYKVPKKFYEVSVFSYTSSGKIDRKQIQNTMTRLNL